MTKNEGSVDRTLRVVAGIGILAFGQINQSWFGLIGLVPLFTGTIGYCPVYSLFGINTCPKA